jgi:hypothetical protein
MLALAMGVGAVGLAAGGAYVAWPRASAWMALHRAGKSDLAEGMPPAIDSLFPPADSQIVAVPAGEATRRLDSLPTLYPAPSSPLPPVPPAKTAVGVAAPEEDTKVTRFTATRTRVPTYYEAYADARSEMDDGFDYVDFHRVFAASRFAAPESLRATRRMIAAAGNILRVYRGREVMLEQTYRPDDPGGRGSLRESFETAEASRELLSDVDSLFGLLVSQQGRVTVTADGVRFQEPSVARNYNQLRSQISATLGTWRKSADASNRVTLGRLLRAFGGSLPPPAR